MATLISDIKIWIDYRIIFSTALSSLPEWCTYTQE